MTKKHSDARFSDLLRHLDYLLEQGQSAQDALNRLRNAAATEDQPLVESLSRLVHGQGSDSVKPEDGFLSATLVTLIGTVKEQNGQPLVALRAFAALQRQVEPALRLLRQEFRALFGYLVTLLVVLLVCFWVFADKVFPLYSSFYADFGTQLPEFTRVTMEIVPWFSLANLPLMFYGIQVYRLTQGLQHWRRLDSSLQWTPGLHWVVRWHNQYLLMVFAAVLVKSGWEAQAGLARAKALVAGGRICADTENSLLLSQGCGTLARELEYQSRQQGESYVQRLQALHQKISAAARIMLSVVIGWLVVAMYLPIFSLGSAL